MGLFNKQSFEFYKLYYNYFESYLLTLDDILKGVDKRHFVKCIFWIPENRLFMPDYIIIGFFWEKGLMLTTFTPHLKLVF